MKEFVYYYPNVWKEAVEKERRARVASWLKHLNQTQRESPKEKGEKPVLRTSVVKLPPINAHKPTGMEVHHKANYEHVGINRPKHACFNITPPICGKDRIFDGTRSRHFKPAEKLHLPPLPIYESDWKLGGVATESKHPVYGRKAIIKDLFYRKNGVFPNDDRLL